MMPGESITENDAYENIRDLRDVKKVKLILLVKYRL